MLLELLQQLGEAVFFPLHVLEKMFLPCGCNLNFRLIGSFKRFGLLQALEVIVLIFIDLEEPLFNRFSLLQLRLRQDRVNELHEGMRVVPVVTECLQNGCHDGTVHLYSDALQFLRAVKIER